jgi:hypothetical protein
VALWAPGYEDEYTDVDAFFLVPSLLPTSALVQGAAHNLFLKTVVPATGHTGVAETQFHDVYYDWYNGVRPYDYAPWFSSDLLTEGASPAFTLGTKNVLSGAARLTVRLWSRSEVAEINPDHALGVTVNGVPVGYQTWDGGGKMLELTFAVPAGVVQEGSNTIELTTPVLGTEQMSFLHALRLEYPQALKCDGPMTVWTKGTGSGVVEVSGLANGKAWVVEEQGKQALLTAYEAKQTASGYAIRWKYPKGREAKYYVVPSGSELAPMSVVARTVAPLESRMAYLAVGKPALGEAVQPLLDARGAEGLAGLFVDQERLIDAYGYGRYGPLGIQRAVRTVRPKYLLLLGRTTYDTKDWFEVGTEVGCPTVFTSTKQYGMTSADGEYGFWGGVAQVAVGRLPMDDAAEVGHAVEKILGYRGVVDSRGSGVILAQNPDPKAGDFHAQGDEVGEAVEVSWTKVYQADGTEEGKTAAREGFLEAVNGGADVAVFVGHGSSTNWASGVLTLSNVSEWTGNAVVLVASCTGAYFLRHPQYPGMTLAEALLGQAGGGTPAFIGSATYTESAPHVEYMCELLKRTQVGNAVRWGDAMVSARNWAEGQSESLKDLGRTEHLLGDPALPVSAPEAPAASGAAEPPPTTTGNERF